MKGNNIFRVALLSYIILTIGGKELKSTNSGENTGLTFTNQQVNKTVQMEPSSSPIRLDIKSPLVAAVSHAQLSTIDCPIGTIPILRNNKLDTTMVQGISTLASNDLQQLVAGIKYWDEIYGSQASINVYEPKVKQDSNDLSASWIQIGSVPKDNEELKKNCIDHNCPGFVQVSRSVGLGGRVHPISVYNGPQYVIDVLIFKDKCNFAFWGGYVQGPTASSDPPQIGSGHFASEGFGKAAFVRNIQAIEDENNKLVTPSIRSAHPRDDNPKLYTYDDYGLNDDIGRDRPNNFRQNFSVQLRLTLLVAYGPYRRRPQQRPQPPSPQLSGRRGPARRRCGSPSSLSSEALDGLGCATECLNRVDWLYILQLQIAYELKHFLDQSLISKVFIARKKRSLVGVATA
uniref:Neprosin PEP catalytic domain-containing protein n=1 Tax=Oryza sativa subsp. japonica TaxID=39947 RepID=Q6K693_ORYSJ|nr:hypothetical protein [Oryza sativa Japonica Group]BAD19649.1 hypothetical protein [Oryza sativa Japonica Group]